MLTYYVVQSFQQGDKGFLIPEEPRELKGPEQARVWAQRLAETRPAVVAFSRTGDPSTGDWSDAEIIFQAGALPDELFEAAV